MSEGYCRIHRKLFDNDIWLLEPFTKGQAWIDLFANANYKDNSFEIRGNIIPVKRGQIGWSEITMAKRWTWSRNKVRRFLKWLETKQQIKQQKLSKLTTIITIINYDKYQPMEQQTIQQKDNRKTTDDTQLIKDNKDKNTLSVSEEQISLIGFWNETLGNKYKPSLEIETNLQQWLKVFSLEEIKIAIRNIPALQDNSPFWKAMRPKLFFRQKNSLGEADYIEQALNVKNNKEVYIKL